MESNITLRLWYGGLFQNHPKLGFLEYVGGEGKTFSHDPDKLGWWDLKEMAEKCGTYEVDDQILYLIPGKTLDDGLVSLGEGDDKDVLTMLAIANEYRTVDMFIFHSSKSHKKAPAIVGKTQTKGKPTPHKSNPPRKKLSPKRRTQITLRSSPRNHSKIVPTNIAPTTVTPIFIEPLRCSPRLKEKGKLVDKICDPEVAKTHYVGEECDNEFVDGGGQHEESEDEFVDGCSEHGESEDEFVDGGEQEDSDDEFVDGGEYEESDDEYIEARDKARGLTKGLLDIARQVLKEAANGELGGQNLVTSSVAPQTSEETDCGHVSEYEESDVELQLTYDSGDELNAEVNKRRSNNLILIGSTNFKTFSWKVGQTFINREAFRDAISRYAVLQGRNLKVSKSDKNRGLKLCVTCYKKCPFRVYGSWDKRRAVYVVKSVTNDHTCNRNMKKNRQMKVSWLGKELLPMFKNKPHWPAKEIKDTVRLWFKVLIGDKFAYNIKYAAHKLLYGSMSDHYNKLGRYLEALKQASPNSSVILLTEQSNGIEKAPVFQRLFVCFDGVRNGWLAGCRKLIVVDSCFLKTFLGGQLMCAVGRDGNDQMFPIAWAAVEGENNESWPWFLKNLQGCLNLGDGTGLAIISDEHQAILNGVSVILPKAEHRHCARHKFAHWHSKFKGEEYKQLFWKAAKAYNRADFNQAMDEMQEYNPDAAARFKDQTPSLFCRAFMQTSMKCDVITSNLAETFNNYIMTARFKHLIDMNEEIRGALMKRMYEKRQQMDKLNTSICPRVSQKLKEEKLHASKCDIIPSSENVFEVRYGLENFVVNLGTRSCSCRKWDMTCIPCCHGVAAISFIEEKAEDYVDAYYTRSTYLKTYSESIPPIVSERAWPRLELAIDPPPLKISPGRPRKNRRKKPHEDPKKPGKLTKHGVVMTCSVCKSTSHNKRKCPDKDHNLQSNPKRTKTAHTTPTIAQRAQSTPTNFDHFFGESQDSISFIHSAAGGGGRGIERGGRGRGRGGGRSNRGGRGVGRGGGRSSIAIPPSDYSQRITIPGKTGKGNRFVRGGFGSRGAKSVRGRNTQKVPTGFGVLIGEDGSHIINEPVRSGLTRRVSPRRSTVNLNVVATQNSVNN